MPDVLIATNADLLKSLSANRARKCTYMSMLSIKIYSIIAACETAIKFVKERESR